MKLSFSHSPCSVALALLIWSTSVAMCCGTAQSSLVAIPPDLPSHPVLKDVEPALLSVTDIDLVVLRTFAVRVGVLDRVPARELVFVHSDGAWELLLANKLLASGWEAVIEARLHRLEDSPCSIDAIVLAQDLTRLLVDPDARYGVVISSAEDIPTNYKSSDVLRDLVRQGHEPSSVRSALLRRAPRKVAPPRLTCASGAARIEYYTWHYFGGEVTRWIVRLGPSQASIRRKSLVDRVGSYDFYH